VEIVLENGCLFLMKGLIAPPTLRFEGQSYSEGWKLLRGLKSSEIDSRAGDCGWNFIFLAETMRRTAFGLGRDRALRKATNKFLAEARKNAFNSVEITEITARQFLGLYCVTVAAHSRSLQKSERINDISMRRRELAMYQCVPGAERLQI
jgi:hypothetical protein